LIFKISKIEWLILCITITLVLFGEFINTAIETTVDLYTEEKNEKAKIAKDVAAGAVVLTSLNAIIVGIIIFVPYIAERII
jgi:diacylglycerol kinase